MFGDQHRRREALDTLTIVPCYVGDYPNFFCDVALGETDAFVADLRQVNSAAAFSGLVERYGVRRTDPRLWETSDWFNSHFARIEPVQAGLLDLDRYGNY